MPDGWHVSGGCMSSDRLHPGKDSCLAAEGLRTARSPHVGVVFQREPQSNSAARPKKAVWHPGSYLVDLLQVLLGLGQHLHLFGGLGLRALLDCHAVLRRPGVAWVVCLQGGSWRCWGGCGLQPSGQRREQGGANVSNHGLLFDTVCISECGQLGSGAKDAHTACAGAAN